jgi:hypothetical protein
MVALCERPKCSAKPSLTSLQDSPSLLRTSSNERRGAPAMWGVPTGLVGLGSSQLREASHISAGQN